MGERNRLRDARLQVVGRSLSDGLAAVLGRKSLEPWGDPGIPWNEPGFSRRMLREHLSQKHDAASRRVPVIDAQAGWLAGLLNRSPGRVLDLGCGPGFHAQRLAEMGHRCTGIDFSPASIEYARTRAAEAGLSCDYRLEDVREASLTGPWNLIYMLFGEFNMFTPNEARDLLRSCRETIAPGGGLVLELQSLESLQSAGEAGPYWYAAESGLFSDAPHLVLRENAWLPDLPGAVTRWFVLDLVSGTVQRAGETHVAYTPDSASALLRETGFEDVTRDRSHGGDEFFYLIGRTR